MAKIDLTKYAAMVANAASQVKISSTVFKNFIADVKAVVDGNYDLLTAVTQQAIINGNFAVNQRVKSGTVTLAAGAYGHDRWKAGASGCTYTFATSANITTITITAGSLVQVIEGLNLFTGTYTLSWTGTAQGKIGAGSYGASGITGTATGGTNLSIEFITGTLSKVQFNAGDQALPFQPRSIVDELALCQRYCQVLSSATATNTIIGAGSANTAASANIFKDFDVQMRVPPTIVATATDWQLADGIVAPTALTAISLSASQNSEFSTLISATVSSGLTVGRPYFLWSTGTGKRIIFDAEL